MEVPCASCCEKPKSNNKGIITIAPPTPTTPLSIPAKRPIKSRKRIVIKLIEVISDKYKDIKIKIIDLNKNNILKNEIENSDLIVNTTSVGMSSGPNPNGNLIEGYELKKNVTGIDLVYSPLVTPFLQSIKDSNGVTVNGIDMLIYQAQVGFEVLTEKKCPFEIMKTALKLNWNVSIYNYMIILGEKYV